MHWKDKREGCLQMPSPHKTFLNKSFLNIVKTTLLEEHWFEEHPKEHWFEEHPKEHRFAIHYH
jgi:hypothetical protein